MNYFLFPFLIIIFSITSSKATEAWGETGHRAIGEIAEQYLSKKTKKHIDQLLGGHSLAFASTYADEIRSDKRFREYDPWHYVNFPFNSTYEAHPKSAGRDIMVAINKCVEILKDKESSDADRVFYLKLLIHFIGDLHQPLHIGLAEDRGGNNFKVKWFGKATNLHSVWDSKLIESYNMSYTEMAATADRLSEAQIREVKRGEVTDWMYESRELCKQIYTSTEEGEKLGYEYRYLYMNTVRSQLQKAGIRLAHLLNEIFA